MFFLRNACKFLDKVAALQYPSSIDLDKGVSNLLQPPVLTPIVIPSKLMPEVGMDHENFSGT